MLVAPETMLLLSVLLVSDSCLSEAVCVSSGMDDRLTLPISFRYKRNKGLLSIRVMKVTCQVE